MSLVGFQDLLEKATCGLGITLGTKSEVKSISVLIYRPLQIGPLAFNLNICFIYSPGLIASFQVWPNLCLDLRSILMNLSHYGRANQDQAALFHPVAFGIALRHRQVGSDW